MFGNVNNAKCFEGILKYDETYGDDIMQGSSSNTSTVRSKSECEVFNQLARLKNLGGFYWIHHTMSAPSFAQQKIKSLSNYQRLDNFPTALENKNERGLCCCYTFGWYENSTAVLRLHEVGELDNPTDLATRAEKANACSQQAIAISAAPDDVHSPITLTQQINQDPGNQRNGSQNDGQNDSDGSQYRPSKTVEAVLADNDADEYEEYYSYEEDHVGAHQETSGKLDKLDVDAKDLPSPAETQNSD
ncbi:hypothetical protein X801_02605, partial [Opisthorchis viverrini]